MATSTECIGDLKPTLGTAMGIQVKLVKHLRDENAPRVRDYLILIRCLYPNFEECPIDFGILKKSSDYLKSEGWKLYLSEDHSERVSKYIRRV